MNLNLYTLVASLPTLSDESADEKAFITECQKMLPAKTCNLLLSCTLDGDEKVHKAYSAWQASRNHLYLSLNKQRSKVFSLKFENSSDVLVESRIKQLYEKKDPENIEVYINRKLLSFADKLQSHDLFSLDWLIFYYIKLQIFKRSRMNSTAVPLTEILMEETV